MKNASLVPCPGCQRHVRADEPACPFCDGEIPDALRNRRAPVTSNTIRLSRAALFAIGTAASAGGGAACWVNAQPEYGAPGDFQRVEQDASTDAPIVDAADGGPPPKDAGEDGDASEGADASDSGDAGDGGDGG